MSTPPSPGTGPRTRYDPLAVLADPAHVSALSVSVPSPSIPRPTPTPPARLQARATPANASADRCAPRSACASRGPNRARTRREGERSGFFSCRSNAPAAAHTESSGSVRRTGFGTGSGLKWEVATRTCKEKDSRARGEGEGEDALKMALHTRTHVRARETAMTRPHADRTRRRAQVAQAVSGQKR
jgi:hypothetical protein